jgi:PAS domain S-box-containing protein
MTPTFPPEVVGAVQALAGAVLLTFLKPALENRDTVGSRSFTAFTVGAAVWIFAYAAGNLTGDYTLSMLAWNFVMLGAASTAASWFLLSLEVTDRITLARRVVPIIVAVVGITQLVAFTNPLHHLFMQPESYIEGKFLHIEFGIGFWVHYTLTYLLTLLAVGVFLIESIRTTGIRRRQALLFLLATVPVVSADLLTFFTDIFDPYNITPFGYLITAGFLGLVLFKGRFLDIMPVARRTAMAEMNDAMVVVDDESRVVDANQRARAIFDVGDDYVGMAATDFFSPMTAATVADVIDETGADSEITVDMDGTDRHFSVTVTPVGSSTSRGSVILLHDITERKQRESTLETQNERLDKFASVVSHDLRNPLGIAKTYLDFAEETGESDDFEATREALERMDTMIDELLTMARAEASVEDTEPLELTALASDAWQTAQTDGASLELDVGDTTVVGDRELLQNIFENLFRNAVDHNPPPITVRVGELDATAEGFYIEDDGSGIPEEDREEIFEHGYTTDEDGTGFGLSIVQEFLAAHEWDVTVTESSDGGARFEIYTDP